MKFFSLLISFLMVFASFAQNQTKSIGFIENKGQIVDQKGKPNTAVKYLLNTNGLNVQIRNNGFSYDVYETKKIKLSKKELTLQNPHLNYSIEKENIIDYKLEYIYHRIDIDFDNSNPNVKLIAEEKSSDYDNYYNVIHAPNGITNVYKYQKITYKNIYNNIDVVFFIPEDKKKPVEYNFILNPGSKIEDIHLKFNGAKTELVDNKIKMNVRFGQMEETLPLSWVENNNSKEEIAISYKKIKNNVFGFESLDKLNDKTIVIDPTPIRLWGTYYGGVSFENEYDSFVKNYQGYTFIGGYTGSASFIATIGSYQSFFNAGILDGFVAKFDNNGQRIFGTYYGGSSRDAFRAMDIDSHGNLFVIGETLSVTNLTTANCYQLNSNGSFEGLIVKFDNNGYRIWATYFGGEDIDIILDVRVDNNDNFIICGYTHSQSNITTINSFHPTKYNDQFSSDGFISKFSSDGQIAWSTYYNSYVTSLDIDSNNNIFFSGYTTSASYDVYTIGAFDVTYSSYGTNYEGFFGKFDSVGNRLFGSLYGGNDHTYNQCIKVDNENNFIISGKTKSTADILMVNSFQETNNGLYDIYLAKFNNDGSIIWNTYYGGEGIDGEDSKIEIDEFNNIILYSSGDSTNFISTNDAYQTNLNGNYDLYIIKFSPIGNRIWATYYGGNAYDRSGGISYAENGEFYISGSTYSLNNISSSNSFQTILHGNTDAFLIKFLDCQSAAIANSNSPVCIGNNIQLSASGGTNYSWTGPNGFTSTLQNPVITNSTALNNGQYSCTITGTIGGCDDTISTNVNVGDNVAPIPNVQNLPTITGDCNTVITSIPTATDNCAGNIVATTTDALNYSIPGNYTIHWTYNDGNGNSINQNQSVTITSVATPTLTSPQNFCFQQNATLNNFSITGQNIKWYTAQTGGIVLPTSTLLQNGSTYYASQTINGCESARVAVTVNIQNTQVPIANSTQSFCSTQNATLSNIVISGTDIKWYSSNNSTIVLPITTVLQNGVTYFATQTVNNCESSNRTSVTINLINTLNASNYTVSFCDDLNDNFEILDLTNYNQNLLNPTTGNIFTFYSSYNSAENQIILDEINPNYTLNLGSYTIFVRIDSSNGCHQIVELKLSLFSKPLVCVNDVMPICEGNSIIIDTGLGYDTYLWSTGEISQAITVSQAGNYWVTLTQNHNGIICSETKSFEVLLSNIALITSIETLDWNDAENYIIINTSGNGDYEYSIDGVNFQNSNIFLGVYNGNYDVIVRDKNGCGLTNENITLLNYPKYFTPNGDAINDFWKIKFSEVEPNLSIKIFDRFGNIITILDSNSQGWDGTYNGNLALSDDYWFIVTRENGKEYKGHFSLKR